MWEIEAFRGRERVPYWMEPVLPMEWGIVAKLGDVMLMDMHDGRGTMALVRKYVGPDEESVDE